MSPTNADATSKANEHPTSPVFCKRTVFVTRAPSTTAPKSSASRLNASSAPTHPPTNSETAFGAAPATETANGTWNGLERFSGANVSLYVTVLRAGTTTLEKEEETTVFSFVCLESPESPIASSAFSGVSGGGATSLFALPPSTATAHRTSASEMARSVSESTATSTGNGHLFTSVSVLTMADFARADPKSTVTDPDPEEPFFEDFSDC